MPAYAIGHFHPIEMTPAIEEYLRRIDETLDPFGGRFLVHGGKITEVEGAWDRTLVIIAFPDREQAQAWYNSPAYQAILSLRTATVTGEVIIVDGVPEGYRAANLLRH